jgi:hypothetical protein
MSHSVSLTTANGMLDRLHTSELTEIAIRKLLMKCVMPPKQVTARLLSQTIMTCNVMRTMGEYDEITLRDDIRLKCDT